MVSRITTTSLKHSWITYHSTSCSTMSLSTHAANRSRHHPILLLSPQFMAMSSSVISFKSVLMATGWHVIDFPFNVPCQERRFSKRTCSIKVCPKFQSAPSEMTVSIAFQNLCVLSVSFCVRCLLLRICFCILKQNKSFGCHTVYLEGGSMVIPTFTWSYF